MTYGYQGLGFDPAPGSVDAVAGASARCRDAARAGDAEDLVEHARLACHDWAGEAAESLAAQLERVPAELHETQRVLGFAADVLDDWAGTLLRNQRTADALDRRARRLQHEISDATDDVARTETDLQFATGAAVEPAQADHGAATRRLDRLRADLDRVLASARLLHDDHHAAAARVAERLRVLHTHGVAAAERLPSRAEEFGGVVTAVGDSSVLAADLGTLLLRGRDEPQVPITAGPGAGAFAMAVAAKP